MRVGLSFDLRNPKQWRRPWRDFYGASLDLISEAERVGVDVIKIAEHHGFEDGYIPQPLTFLAAAAARTSRIRLSTGILTAPLHSAVEIAEQAAVVDGLSGGRLELALGIGYRKPEYDLYGVNFDDRFKLFSDRVRAIRDLWTSGKTTPQPVQSTIPMWAGVQGPKTCRMAGRLGMGLLFLPDENWQSYLDGLEEGGHGKAAARLGGSLQAILADDPEQAFEALAPMIEHSRYSYAWYGVENTGKPLPKPMRLEELKEAGLVGSHGSATSKLLSGGRVLQVLSPEEAASQILAMAKGRNIDTVYIAGAVSGQVDSLALRNAELLVKKLKPLLATA